MRYGVVSLVVCGLAAAASGQNLLSNSSFEQGLVFSGGPGSNPGQWAAFFGGSGGVDLEASTGVPAGVPAPSGTRVLRLEIDGAPAADGLGFGAFVGVSQRVGNVIPGAAYTFGFSARSAAGVANAGLEFRLEWISASGGFVGDPFDPSDPVFNTVEIASQLGGSFEDFELTAVAPAGAVALNATIAAQSFLNDGVNPAFIRVEIDNAALIAEDVPPPPPPAPTFERIVLSDEFDGNALDGDLWFQPTGQGTFLGRTQMRPPSFPIEVSGGTAKLIVETFNPTGFSFFGSEIRTRDVFQLGLGLVFETRSRLLDGTPGGVLGSLFMFTTDGVVRDEIDFEILSNDIPGPSDRILTNVFVDDDFSQPGDASFVQLPGFDITEFNDYRIEWLPDRVDWYINGELVRRETQSVPDGLLPGTVFDPVRIHLNAWAPDQFFGVAFNPGIQPTGNPSLNQVFTYEVDRVRIARLVPGCSPADNAAPFGTINFADASGFIAAFNTGGEAADINGNGVVSFADVPAFIAAFNAGCP